MNAFEIFFGIVAPVCVLCLLSILIFFKYVKPYCLNRGRGPSMSRVSSMEHPPCRLTDSMLDLELKRLEEFRRSVLEQGPCSSYVTHEGRFYDCREDFGDEDPEEGPSNPSEDDLITTEELVRNYIYS